MKEINNQNLWIFEPGSHENMIVHIWINNDFQQRARQDSQNWNNDTFCRLLVTSCQAVIATEKYFDASVYSIYDDDDYSQGYHQIKETFTVLIKDNILQPYKYHIMPSDLQMLALMLLVINYMFLIQDISKILQLPKK